MTQGTAASDGPQQRRFPSIGDSLNFGWETFKDNLGLFLVFGLLSGILYLLGGISFPSDNSTAALIVLIIVAVVATLLSVLISLAAIRRVLDYWDERNGLAQPRDFSTAFSDSMKAAAPRVFPSIGWTLLVVIGIMLVIFATIVILVAIDALWLTLIVILVEVVAAFYLAVTWGFFMDAIADRPGNPFKLSAEVAKGHFWDVLGTFIILGIISWILSALMGLIVIALVSSIIGLIVSAIVAIPGTALLYALVHGAMVNMYRSVFPSSES